MESLNVNVSEQKMRITSYIQVNGPVVGQNVAKKMGLQSFLASALISELLKEKVVKQSFLRVGGSPLYFVRTQEEKLDNFIKFLAMREREAFKLLKEKSVLDDLSLEPAIRVAFRNMKDFAVPLSVTVNEENKLFWKFHTFSSEEAQVKIKQLLKKMPKRKKVEKPKPEVRQASLVNAQESKLVLKPEMKKEEGQALIPKVVSAKPKAKKPGVLPQKVQEWMQKENVVMKEEIESEGRMFKAVVEVKSAIGTLDFLLIAINKKSVNEGELALCYQEGIERKMPVLLLMNGKPSKKGQKILEGFKGHVTMRKL